MIGQWLLLVLAPCKDNHATVKEKNRFGLLLRLVVVVLLLVLVLVRLQM